MQIVYDNKIPSKYKDKIINGKELSQKILQQLNSKIDKGNIQAGLAAILVGNSPSSHLYVRLKKQACEKCNLDFHQYLFEGDFSEKEILEVIDFLNKDTETTGIIVQLPLPEKFDTDKIIEAIDPRKDIDGFHPVNRAKMAKCQYVVPPPLTAGIVEMIKATKEPIKDKEIVILCNNELFGQPFECFFGQDNKITITTPKDKDHKQMVQKADILIVSVGLPYYITKDLVKEGAIVIDVGINQLPNSSTVVGDVDLPGVIEKVKYISPVPGGVGPMTVAMLLQNLVTIKEKTQKNTMSS